jgi:hypothetical protein
MSNNRNRRKPTQARPRPVAPNALAAEATGGTLVFEFRGHAFELDPASIDFNKAAFAINVASRGVGSLIAQAGMMVDAFEALLGKDKLADLYELAPDLFSSADAQREFWESFAKATIGGTAGESPAS